MIFESIRGDNRPNIFNKTLLCFSLVFSVFFLGCGVDFEQHFNKINEDMVRPVSYMFGTLDSWTNSAETAPGDTVVLSVFFTGKQISLNDVKWRANWNVFTDEFGRVAPRGEDVNLEILDSYIRETMGGQMLTAAFVIPKDILHKADIIPDDLTQLQSIFNIGDIDGIEGLPNIATKSAGLAFLEELSANSEMQLYFSNQRRDLLPRIDGLAQILSSMYEIYLYIPNTPRTVIRHTARWHGRLSNLVSTNNNPGIPELSFSQGRFPIGNSYGNSPVRISLSAHRITGTDVTINFSSADRFFTLEQAFSPRPQRSVESFRIRLFFSSSIHGKADLESGSLVNMGSFEGNAEFGDHIVVHRDKIKVGDSGWLWVVVFDERYGVANFPQGRNVVGVPVVFVQ